MATTKTPKRTTRKTAAPLAVIPSAIRPNLILVYRGPDLIGTMEQRRGDRVRPAFVHAGHQDGKGKSIWQALPEALAADAEAGAKVVLTAWEEIREAERVAFLNRLKPAA